MKQIVLLSYLIFVLLVAGLKAGTKTHDIEEPEGGLIRYRVRLGQLYTKE